MSGRLFLYASRIGCVIWGGGHAVRGETGKWHDCGEGGGHAVRGEIGKWHDIGEKGSQFARSRLTRLLLKEDK